MTSSNETDAQSSKCEISSMKENYQCETDIANSCICKTCITRQRSNDAGVPDGKYLNKIIV